MKSMGSEVRIVVTLGEEWGCDYLKETWGGLQSSGNTVFLLWLLVTRMCSLCENSLGWTFTWTPLHVGNISIKSWEKTIGTKLKDRFRASLVVQWLRIRLPMQGTRVRTLVWEDPTCRGATKPMRHSYWGCAPEPASHNYWSPRA